MPALRALAFTVCVASLTACTKTEDHLREIVTQHSDLIDPGSAIFRHVTHRAYLWETWCGEINAKNKVGGYTGWERFMITVHKDGTVFFNLDPTEVPADANEVRRKVLEMVAKDNEAECQQAQPAPIWMTPFFKRFEG
ncbi:hypothetical protein BSFP_057500 [Burkholderia stabilis]|uniref:Lipoprotein n=2 Tax=Burkholderia stabilis TaxID=95485 RepID=A0A1Y1BS67_9BURK|nr:hypothetical protein BSFP_057500 [Burkholderia stabilis]